MIPIQAEPSEWNSEHCKILRDFLNSSVGQLALAHVCYASPALGDGADVNKTLVSTGKHQGYEDALRMLISLTYEKPSASVIPPNPEFPDLDDDSQWSDSPRPLTPKS